MSKSPTIAEYGFWKSPITSDLVASATIRLGEVAVSGEETYWIEGRPAERGRSVLVRRAADGSLSDITPPPFNVRNGVHEYGGGAFCVAGDAVYFTNHADQRIYCQHLGPQHAGRQQPGKEPVAITPEGAWRYADLVVDQARNRLLCVREDHTQAGEEPVNTIVAVDLGDDPGVRVLVEGSDFYSNPRLSPDGSRLAWLGWNHPHMPWESTELWVAEIDGPGLPGQARRIAGGESESVFQPEWSPDGILHFISDRSGWWNLYRWIEDKAQAVVSINADCGLPQWVFGQSTYSFAGPDELFLACTQNSVWQLYKVNSSSFTYIKGPYTEISEIHASGTRVVFRGGGPSDPSSIVELDFAEITSVKAQTLKRSFEVDGGLAPYFSTPQTIEFPTDQGRTAYAFFYPARNPDYSPPPGELPPLIVISHGGPTGATSSSLSLASQYWTSRGFAILDVNYGGSTGYGRAYRERLRGQWGVVDVDDCVNGAKFAVAQGWADGDRLIIRGGSAGGYTTLAALAFRDVFRAGASYYGVGDIEALMRDTHKFEARYDHFLIGPYPEQRDLFVARSPIHHVDKLSAPVIFFQGSDDMVVPPNQAEAMVEALRKKGVPVSYFLFEGEQHGFRQADNIKRALDAELYFYAAMLLKKGLRF